MKKILTVIMALSLILVSCHKTNDPQIIKKRISHYKTVIEHYQEKISKLEQQLPAEEITAIPVKVETVRPQVFNDLLEVTATIQPIEYAFINPQASGTIKAIYVHEGDYVNKGQLLMELDDALIRRNIAQLQVQLNLADSLYKKQKALYAQGVVSQVQYLQAKNQRDALEKKLDVLNTQLKYTKVYAPFNGIVDQINVRVGELAGPQVRAMYIVNMTQMKAIAHVSENYLPYVHKGDPVIIKFPIYGNMEIKTRISRTGNVIDPTTGTFDVEALFANRGMKIKPNMSATMHFVTFKTKDAIIVPTQVLKDDSNGWFLYIAQQQGNKYIAAKRYVTIGKITASNAMILSGLKPGDKVITEGFHLVHQGSIIKIAN